jgi:acetyl esterase/lipase
MNFTGWSARLGEQLGAKDVLPAAAPARLTNFHGLASAYIEVGALDIFRDESIAYAQRLALAEVPIELHVHGGAPHGFERFAPTSALARRALNDRLRVIESI